MIAEYHVVKSPDYDYQETKRRKDSKKKRAEKVTQELQRWQKQTPILAEKSQLQIRLKLKSLVVI